MQPSERRTVTLTALVTPSEAARIKELTWKARRPLSGWLREVAIRAAERLARVQETK
jgi:hypothetical protein